MISIPRLARRLTPIVITTVLSVLVPAQTPPPHVVGPHLPVGRWIAEHPSTGGISSWWEFRADGTFTMFFGVMVSDHIDRSGDTFMMTSGMAKEGRVRATYTIRDNVLSIETGASHPTTYARIGTAPNPADPLIGSWRPIPRPEDATGNPNMALMQQVMSSKGMLVFTPDGMQYLRVPLGTREGVWDDHANTFRIKDDPVTYAFARKDSNLLLAQPPNGREMDSYRPDPLPVLTGAASPAAIDQRAEAPVAAGIVHQGPDVVMPQVTHSVEPAFTEKARRRKIRGVARVEVVVDADGHHRTPRIVKSISEGYTNPADREAALTLDQKAVEAVNEYTFAPGTKLGKHVPILVTVEVSFDVL